MEPSISPGSLPAKSMVGLQSVAEEKDVSKADLIEPGFFFNVVLNLIQKRDDFLAQRLSKCFSVTPDALRRLTGRQHRSLDP